MHSYHSYVSMPEDQNAGLVGPQMTYQRGMMNHTMSTHREIPLLYMHMDEAKSFLAETNAHILRQGHPPVNHNSTHLTLSGMQHHGNQSFWRPQLVNLASAQGFTDAPQFYSMNGWVFANNPTFEMCLNEKVIWYVYGKCTFIFAQSPRSPLTLLVPTAYGSASHVFHMHGNGFQFHGVNKATQGLNDGNMAALYMNATGKGLWQVICHVNNHVAKGMVSNYWVMTDNCPAINPGSS